jgi:hypothetical protein
MADTSLWPVVVGGLLGVGGTMVGVIGTTIRDVAQQRHEKAKRRADKFEELVAAVYEFDHWLDSMRDRDAFGQGDAQRTASPFAKVQSISSVYFPQFSELIGEIDRATSHYRTWIWNTEQLRRANATARLWDGFNEVSIPYVQKREALLGALTKFARDEFQ